MFKERASTTEAIFLVSDTIVIAVAFGLAVALRFFHDALPLLSRLEAHPGLTENAVWSEYALSLLISVAAWVTFLRRSRLYRRAGAEDLRSILITYVKAAAFCVFATSAMVFGLKIQLSRLLFGYFFTIMLALGLCKQLAIIAIIRRARNDDSFRRNALVIGAATPAHWLASVIRDSHASGHRLTGVLTTDSGDALSGPIATLGTIDDLDVVLAANPVDDVFLVGAARELLELAPIAQDLSEQGRTVSLVSVPKSGKNGVRGRVTEFNGVPMITFGPMPQDEMRSGVRRATDIVASSVGLALLSPLLLSVAGAIRILDPGPVLFAQERLGRGGRRFKLYKFRSMKQNAEAILRDRPDLYARYLANDFKLPSREDPRISPFGHFLRKSSLDELPQLWNILRGEMTLVGPRPIVPKEIEMYRPYEGLFLAVKPGLTGRWQANGRSDISYPERTWMELDYVNDNSLLTDFSILLRTFPAILRGRGAH